MDGCPAARAARGRQRGATTARCILRRRTISSLVQAADLTPRVYTVAMATDRRNFIRAAVATAASYGRIMGANERIRIAGIGTGGRGEYLLGNVAKIEGTEIVRLLRCL